MMIVPAIDIMDGRCVRLRQGLFEERKDYSDSPLWVARHFAEKGFTHLHLVDLDGARTGSIVHWNVVEDICRETRLEIDFGGGINSEKDVQRLLSSGVEQVNIGSLAVRQPEIVTQWIRLFGHTRIIVSADVKNGLIAVDGWTRTETKGWMDFISYFALRGLRWLSCTDILRDGMLLGAHMELYQSIREAFPDVKLVASGGVSAKKDLEDLLALGVERAIAGRALYEGVLPIEVAVDWNKKN